MRIKLLRLQVVAGYAGFRLLSLLGRIRDAEFIEILISSIEDSDPLLGDALEYSLDKNVVALTSFLRQLPYSPGTRRLRRGPFSISARICWSAWMK